VWALAKLGEEEEARANYDRLMSELDQQQQPPEWEERFQAEAAEFWRSSRTTRGPSQCFHG
ncbi:MAG: hypothetical protein ACR2NM_10935, partial [Bythopirellula sp.]